MGYMSHSMIVTMIHIEKFRFSGKYSFTTCFMPVYTGMVLGLRAPLQRSSFMSDGSTGPAVNPTQKLTVADVIKPRVFGEDALSRALAAKAASAGEALTKFNLSVLDAVQSYCTTLATRKAALEAELAKIAKEEARVNKAAAYAQSSNNTLPLAAVVGRKQEAIAFLQSVNVVVPPSDSSEWSVPE